jgi:hypothetical protein
MRIKAELKEKSTKLNCSKRKVHSKVKRINLIKISLIRIVLNIILIRIMSSYNSLPLELAQEWPLNMIANEFGQINCGWVMLACNLIIDFS